MFPQQTGNAPVGAVGFAWRTWEVQKLGKTMTWRIDGKLIATADVSAVTVAGDNIYFGQADINAGSSTDANGRFHFQLTEVARWTVTFDDPALGVWAGRSTETDVVTASPGDAFEFHVIFNGKEGPVRIHEHLQVVVGADGNLRVDLDQVTTDYGACPS